ncbi:MAG: CHAD domain-containing protein [Lentisphaerae bacterium]|nr:CHAD domain-containing protein [Lentisphaerota bacterium]
MSAREATRKVRRASRREVLWVCPDGVEADAALAVAALPSRVAWGVWRREIFDVLDTGDGDLTRAGLAVVAEDGQMRLCRAGRWQARGALARQDLAPGGGAGGPAAAPVRPTGALAARLPRRLASRTLEVVGRLRRQVRAGTWRDEAGRVVARLRLEAVSAADDGPSRRVTLLRVTLPVADRAVGRAIVQACRQAGLQRRSVLALAGLQARLLGLPDPAVVRPRCTAPAEAPAGPAAMALAAALLDAMRRYEDGIRRDLDPECLHLYRVQLRRLRTLLSLLRRVLPPTLQDGPREVLRALAKRSNPLRDLDVLLQDEAACRRQLPEDLQPCLDKAFALMRRRRNLERGRLVGLLRSPRYAAALDDLRQAFLTAAATPAEGAAAAPIGHVVHRRVEKLFRRLVRRAERLPRGTSDADFHRLRVQCKRLRYLVDLFRPALAAAPAAGLTAVLKDLQAVLGSLNDQAVQRRHLQELIQQPVAAAASWPAAVEAALARRLDRRRRLLARRARQRLRALRGRSVARLVRRLGDREAAAADAVARAPAGRPV